MLLERAGIPLNFLSIGFLVLLKYNLSVFACVNINGVSYLASAPNELCYTPQVRGLGTGGAGRGGEGTGTVRQVKAQPGRGGGTRGCD